MAEVYLQEMVEDIGLDALPVIWTAFDLADFSRSKRLWDYQQEAVENAIKVLWKYFRGFQEYQKGEALELNLERKQKFYEWYEDNGLEADLDISLKKLNRKISVLLSEYYEVQNGKISYLHFINCMSFWMATGSGKTLVLIKLIHFLRDLIKSGEIPPHDILILTHRDDLIEQLKRHVHEFNASHSNIFIKLRELKEHDSAKWEDPSLFKDQELTVFYYRSDNLSDEQKEKIIDFRNYDNEGRWYLFLDEAHKGDKEDSKRQHIYSILSRNGFLFNFSATFTDPRDLVTTVSNFNLSEFIKGGYGKHIAILKQEIRAFRDDEDYSNEEKQKVVLKSLMMLTYVRKHYEEILSERDGLYHKPMLLSLVNSVNTEDADLKLFFRELEAIGKGEISDEVWQQAKDELWEEMKERPDFIFEQDKAFIEQRLFQALSLKDILEWIYNSGGSGEIEIIIRPSNRHELAFKLKTSDRPFALIKIGDISGWLKEELAGYEVNERFEDESFFERLNEDDSAIAILMGSRSFYEGWDSNRPNVINFINIGIGTEAKKFILQSVGRGVRIEPLRDKRKRLLQLYNSGEVEDTLFHQIKGKVQPVESLFIFGTNRNALQTVIQHLDQQKRKKAEQQLSLFVNEDAKGRKLLIPVYRRAEKPLIDYGRWSKFEITADELNLLKNYIHYIQDDRVLLALYETEPKKIGILKNSLKVPDSFYKQNGRNFKNLDLLICRLFDYFGIIPQEFERLKELKEEIKHFENIKVTLKDIAELENKIAKVKDYQKREALKEKVKAKFERGEITIDRYTEEIEKAALMVKEEQAEYEGKRIQIKHTANHYYLPIILSGEKERVKFIKHIIQTPSEVDFINRLEGYLKLSDHKFKNFDWWLFSKLDESLDEVYIPYYNPKRNDISRFNPDFIFWLQKGDDYFIVFIDPKGTEHTEYEHKIDGYKRVFEDDGEGKKVIDYDKLKTKVYAFLYTDDTSKLSQGYKRYWFDNIGDVLSKLINDSQIIT